MEMIPCQFEAASLLDLWFTEYFGEKAWQSLVPHYNTTLGRYLMPYSGSFNFVLIELIIKFLVRSTSAYEFNSFLSLTCMLLYAKVKVLVATSSDKWLYIKWMYLKSCSRLKANYRGLRWKYIKRLVCQNIRRTKLWADS